MITELIFWQGIVFGINYEPNVAYLVVSIQKTKSNRINLKKQPESKMIFPEYKQIMPFKQLLRSVLIVGGAYY